MLAHSPIAGESLNLAPPYEELLHIQIAQMARYLMTGVRLSGSDEKLFNLTFSFVFVLFLSCVSGAAVVRYLDVEERKDARQAHLAWLPKWRVRFTLVEVLLLVLVLAPILAIWTLAGGMGMAFLGTWIIIGVAATLIASNLPSGWSQLLVPLLICTLSAMVIARVDGNLASREMTAAMQVITGAAIGTACGLSAIVSRLRASRKAPPAGAGEATELQGEIS